MDTIAKIGMDCVGCRSCEQSCPSKCITIVENSEGFLYPVIAEDVCVKCGVCLKKCPINMTEKEEHHPLHRQHIFKYHLPAPTIRSGPQYRALLPVQCR